MDKRSLTCVVIAVAVFVICLVGLLLMPALQGSRSAVEAEASVHLERARRLLDKYDASLAYKSVLIDQLVDVGLEPDPEDVADSLSDEYQQIHTSLWEAYRPNDWPEGASPRPAKASYGNLLAQVRDGIDTEEALIEKNDGLLDEALEAVEEALSVSRGGESSETHAEANRLKGTILRSMGAADQVRAQQLRREADHYRHKLVALAAKAAEAESAATLVESSRVEEQIAVLRTKAAEAGSSAREDRSSLEALDAQVRELERRLSDARARQDEAWSAMQKLQAAGVDLANPGGAESFRQRLEALSDAYREAAREVQTLEYGTPRPSEGERTQGHPLGSASSAGSGATIPTGSGLRHYRNERTVLAAGVAALEQAARGLHADLSRREEIKGALQAAQDSAAKHVVEVASAASDVYKELDRIDSEAFDIEDNALELLEESAQVSEEAAEYAQSWVSEANKRALGMSAEAKERSALGARLDDGWMAGYTTAHVADARLAKAWIYCSRYQAYSWSADVLGKVAGPLQLKKADADSERVKAKEAHDLGVEEVSQAMKALEEAHNGTGRHWTLTAQAAGATYMLALFGHEDYVDDAVEAYRLAIKGREDQDVSQAYVARLNRLEKQ